MPFSFDRTAIQTHLRDAGVDHPDREIERILAYCNDNHDLFHQIIQRRVKREPLERIFGVAEFYDLKFKLAETVFKPGFETETTMEYGYLYLKDKSGPVRILDLGTGTGCILLSLLHTLPNATGLGVDNNPDALTLAQENAHALNLSDRAEFRKTDWMDGIEDQFDLVISNPPRIPTAAIPHLVREVSHYDPKGALDGGDSGIEFYQRTAAGFRRLAKPGALGVLQVGGIVAAEALQAFRDQGYTSATIKRDYKTSPNAVVFGNDPEPARGWTSRLWKLIQKGHTS